VRVILHIGTHKTGTSALQECLRRNEKILARKGIHYARMAPYKNCNGLARTAAKSRGPEVEAFVSREIDKALAVGAHTLVMSAESFYAMTMFFHKFNGRRRDYWTSERESVEFFQRAFPQGVAAKPIVFFRRQDRFLESIYGEVVKSRGVAMPIDEFGIFFREALDYRRHVEIWSALFPDCAVYSYEQASHGMPDFFLRNILDLPDTDAFDGLDERMNIRLNRDVIEYKRMLNATEMSEVDRYLSELACAELAKSLPEDGVYKDYLVPQARTGLMEEMAEGNAFLSEKFAMKPFPPVAEDSAKDRMLYPGLAPEKAEMLAERYARIRRSGRYRVGRLALLARQFIRERLPKFSWIIPFGRSLSPQRRRSRL
jgi:hypothetical protein